MYSNSLMTHRSQGCRIKLKNLNSHFSYTWDTETHFQCTPLISNPTTELSQHSKQNGHSSPNCMEVYYTYLFPHLLLFFVSLDRASEWIRLWTVNWCRWTWQTRGRWKPLLRSCWEPALPVPHHLMRRTLSSKPWRTLNGSCRWKQNKDTTVLLYFITSTYSQHYYGPELASKNCVRSTVAVSFVCEFHIMGKSTLKLFSQGKLIRNDEQSSLSCWLSDWPPAFVLTLNIL